MRSFHAAGSSCGCGVFAGWTCDGAPLDVTRIRSHGDHMAIMVCRGKTELKCKGEKSDTCYEVDLECLGVAFPAFKTCKGLTTQHITTSTGEVHLVLSSLPCLCYTTALGRSRVA